MKLIFAFILVFILNNNSQASPNLDRPWPSQSRPTIMSKKFEMELKKLPRGGIVIESQKYWSSDYWPLQKGNINLRWYAKEPRGFNLHSPTKNEALKMNLEELSELAPSEKLDLLMGRYSYSLKQQVSKRASPRRKEWEGICHGWAGATLNHNEPTPKILRNRDGIDVPFGSSDIKALLSYYYAYYYRPVSIYQMGRRCPGSGQYCDEDLNAGAFHIVLANKVGLEGEGFITDIDNGREVWNQVVHSFVSNVIEDDLPPANNSAVGTVKMVRIRTKMKVVFNIVKNSWEPVIGTPLQTYKTEEYEYYLDLNSDGKILGGEWISKARPDFMWRVAPVRKFTGFFTGLEKLLN